MDTPCKSTRSVKSRLTFMLNLFKSLWQANTNVDMVSRTVIQGIPTKRMLLMSTLDSLIRPNSSAEFSNEFMHHKGNHPTLREPTIMVTRLVFKMASRETSQFPHIKIDRVFFVVFFSGDRWPFGVSLIHHKNNQ